MGGRVDGWAGGWVGGWMGGRVDGWAGGGGGGGWEAGGGPTLPLGPLGVAMSPSTGHRPRQGWRALRDVSP